MRYTTATRHEGEARLREFIPRMGATYARGRNFDKGPDAHRDVSGLSPFVRRRLVLEEDLISAALSEHGLEGAEKFIQEVVWRGYFKGWLERRPQIWDSYRDGLLEDLSALERDRSLRRAVLKAETGETGLECFDAWAVELVETGYLHNHARMWFASIWIFTLGLPWRLGADFFFRHLLDGDPASNTLGWRWAAGLHTRGKAYAAQAWNISKFTGQRFTPAPGELSEFVEGLEHTEPQGLPQIQPLRMTKTPEQNVPTALLITEEDCRIEDFPLDRLDLRGVASLSASHLRSPLRVSDAVKEFERGALEDTLLRGVHAAERLLAGVAPDLAKWAAGCGARQIVTPYVPTGPLRDWLSEAQPALNASGIAICEFLRPWDRAIWPHATAGFFKVKQKIPKLLSERGLL